jgi:hypothetical protein
MVASSAGLASGDEWLVGARRFHAGTPINELSDVLLPLDLGCDDDVVYYPCWPWRQGERMQMLTATRSTGWLGFLPIPMRWRSAGGTSSRLTGELPMWKMAKCFFEVDPLNKRRHRLSGGHAVIFLSVGLGGMVEEGNKCDSTSVR